LSIRKREEDSPDRYLPLKRFQLNTSTEDSPIFEAKPRGLPQYYDPGKQGKTFTRKHFAIEETPLTYFDQASTDTDENAGEETAE
jgi:hypothetical protein